MYNEVKKIESFVNYNLLGEVTLDILDFWINLTNNEIYIATNQKFNAYLYDLHQKLNE